MLCIKLHVGLYLRLLKFFFIAIVVINRPVFGLRHISSDSSKVNIALEELGDALIGV